MNIEAFNRYIVRTPVFPTTNIEKRENLELFNEGLFLSSQGFYMIYNNSSVITEKQSLVMEKFWRRACFRCTPFGLFAGCSVGKFGAEDNLTLRPLQENTRKSRLDMGCLGMISEYVKTLPEVYQNTRYYINTSLYEIHDEYRYIEYLIDKHLIRSYELVSVDYSFHLHELLKLAKDGLRYDIYVDYLVSNNYSQTIAENFINELIEAQILISEIDLQVTGEDPLNRLIEILEPIKSQMPLIYSLRAIKENISFLDDNQFQSKMKLYKIIQDELKQILPNYELRNFLQVDLFKAADNFTLSNEILKKVKRGIEVLGLMNSFTDDKISRLHQFKSEFMSRFGEKEVSLMHALDVDCGIGYNQFVNHQSDDSQLIEGLIDNHSESNSILLSEREIFLLKKLNKAAVKGDNKIELKDSDFSNIDRSNLTFPITFSAFVELLQDNNDININISYVGGSSATNFIGRFGSTNKEISSLIDTICEKESQLIGTGKIIAEIVFIPDSRVGNVLLRPGLRKYEIPFMANSSLDLDHQISVRDLLISVRNNKIRLYSSKLKKEIIPRLSCAHNYTYKTLHVYQFLCDLQHQNTKPSLSFNWGQIENLVSYLPRVCYENIIFSPATWILEYDDKIGINKETVNVDFENIVALYELPSKVMMEEGDQKLLLDFDKEACRKIFMDSLRKKGGVKLSECLQNSGVVKGPEGDYMSEFIIPFYKNY